MVRALLIGLATLGLSGQAAMAAETDAAAAAAGVVAAFNEAVTARDMDTAMGLLADGSVQFQVQPAHSGVPADSELTTDLAATWQVVAAILFPNSEAYERAVEITSAQASGELAVVWTKTRTRTQMKGKPDASVKEFSEMWLLINKDDSGWKIAGNASNRPTDSLQIG